MARFRYQHIKSSVEGKAPTAAQLKVAEIGVNDFAGDEKLFIKNSTGDVVDFPRGYSREYIDDNERVIAESLNDLNSRKLDSSAYTEIWESGTGKSSAVLKGSSGTASGDYSVAEGHQTSGTGVASHAEGGYTTASGHYSHVEGQSSNAIGENSHAEGHNSIASGSSSHAEGAGTVASGSFSHAEGSNTTASGFISHAEGNLTKAIGDNSHAEGSNTTATGYYSHAEGYNTTASGSSSHAEGQSTSATSSWSHAEGQSTMAFGTHSHAEGNGTKAAGSQSHAEGYNTTASGSSSHAEGSSSNALGNYSHAEGYNTKTYNKAEHASGQYNISSSASTTFGDSGNTLFSVGNGISSNNKHNAFEIRQNGDIYIVNKDGDDVRLQDEIGNIDVDQVLDDTTSASTNPVSTSAVYKAVTDNELVWTNAFVVISGAISSHTENTEIHVTAADKEKLHTHSNKAALDSITGNVGTMAYEDKASYSSATEVNTALGGKANTASTLAGYGITNAYTKSETSGATELTTAFAAKANTTDLANFFDDAKYEDSGNTKVINFYHGNTIKATIDASDFIVDGMVDDVKIENGYLVIDFNTASGKQDISIPLTDIFDPSNYYNKIEIDNLVGSGFTSSSITDVIIENEEIVSNALTDLDGRKLDASAYTPTDLSNYYTKSETSGKTEISTALQGKVNSATFTAHTADTSIHLIQIVSAATVSSNLSNVTCPDSITGSSKNGAQALVIYENSGDTTDYTVTVSTSYESPDGVQITLICPKNGYCEISYVNIMEKFMHVAFKYIF